MNIYTNNIKRNSSLKIFMFMLMFLTLTSFFTTAFAQDYIWKEKFPKEAPSPRFGHAMAYDSIREKVILFGGMGESNSDLKNDTWKWDGSDWEQLFPLDSPDPRVHHHMVYDSGRDKIIMFGGSDGKGLDFNDLWEWDGHNWIKRDDIPEPKPKKRRAFGMAYDNISGRIYIFGGYKAIGDDWLDDFWYFDGSSWTHINQLGQPKPSERAQVRMEFDESRNVIFLHGGHYRSGNILNDSWIWHGDDDQAYWEELDPVQSPSKYTGFAMEYMRNEGVIVKFGGETAPDVAKNETWIWNWQNWDELKYDNLPDPPAPREGARMAYEIKRKNIVMFGGIDDNYGDYRIFDDTWIFSPINQKPVAVCKNIELPANENCQTTITPEDVDGGSYDPDDDEITLSVDNIGPFTLGEHYVNLTATDEHGESHTCQATITVVDTNPPEIFFSYHDCVNVGKGKGKMANKLIVSAQDNCTDMVYLIIDKVEIFNNRGQLVKGKGVYDILGHDIYVYPNANGWSIKVTATAIDGSDNLNTQTLEKALIKCKK